MSDDNHEVLKRIANALERIANALENANTTKNHNSRSLYERIQNDFQHSTDIFSNSNYSLSQLISSSTIEMSDRSTFSSILKPEFIQRDVIREFLDSKGIQIKTVPQESEADTVINSLAEFLGNHYVALEKILAKIKRCMQHGASFSLSIKDYSQQDISDICQFCTRLHEIAFLEEYIYFKSPTYLIKAKTTTEPRAQNFFAGQWLERYVLVKVRNAIAEVQNQFDRKLTFDYLLNPQIILNNGDDFELDLIFHVENIFFWIESKSTDYQYHINKYSRMSRHMGLDISHTIVVLTDIPRDKIKALTDLYQMTICTPDKLQEQLIETMCEDLGIV
ncbi:hypothetical protein [Geitlerinema sp. PCC 9228]|uniref:hypothetical protein n=1 Tax=Geitlerinema sp. PCC 9228 TaxID=111611 RepID=UPI0008F9CB7D|nr:hypothetical protein [Geitlerinema sp. PCC 9228]